MREFVTDEMLLALAYGADARTRFVAVGDFGGTRLFVSPPEVVEAIHHELDMELLPHVALDVVGGEVRPLDLLDTLPPSAREKAHALELAGHVLWAFHAAKDGAIVAIGVDATAPTRALEVSGLQRVADATYGARWTLDLLDPRPPRPPPAAPVRPGPCRPAPSHRLDLHATDVSAALAALEKIVGVALARPPATSSQKLGTLAHDPSRIDRTAWHGEGVAVRFEREVQHLDGIDVSYRIDVVLHLLDTTITFTSASEHPVVRVRGNHPRAPAIAAWMRALVRDGVEK